MGGRTGQNQKRTNRNRMKKQTAVQWLMENIPSFLLEPIFKKALEMEKQQIAHAYERGEVDSQDAANWRIPAHNDFDEYYEKTYGAKP